MNEIDANEIDEVLRDAGARLRDTAPTSASTEGALESLGVVNMEDHPAPRRRFRFVAPLLVAAAVVALGVVVLTRTTHDAVVPVDTTPVPTDGEAPSTSAPTPAPTAAPTTVALGTAWAPADGPSSAYIPCCGANVVGPASPALTASGEPLADGTYPASVEAWSPDDPTRLGLAVRRFVPCADVDVTACTRLADGSYQTDEMVESTEPVDQRDVDITLDDSVTVVLMGPDLSTPDSAGVRNIERATDGAGFARYLSALAAAYEEAIGVPLTAGTPAEEVIAELQARPRLGFSSAAESGLEGLGDLYYSDGDAPAVVFAGVSSINDPSSPMLAGSGTSTVRLHTIDVRDGATTLYFYTGFQS